MRKRNPRNSSEASLEISLNYNRKSESPQRNILNKEVDLNMLIVCSIKNLEFISDKTNIYFLLNILNKSCQLVKYEIRNAGGNDSCKSKHCSKQ